MQNSSGQGAKAIVPPEIDKWNWGAFLLNWIWGIGNSTFVALLMIVPLVNLVVPFVLGAKGNAWAWRNRKWESVAHFKATQRQWARWGVIVYVLVAAAFAGLAVLIVVSFKNTDAFKLAEAKLQANQVAAQVLGRPISTGMPMGSVHISGPRGKATLTFSVSGPIGKGTVFMDATKDLGQWQVDRMVLEQEGSGRRFDLEE
jgi:hypothetical protein